MTALTSRIRNRLRSHWIDLRPVRAAKVVGIGLPKTGTTSLGHCFRRFGFKHRSYDMDLAVQVKRKHLAPVLAEAEKFEAFEDWPWFSIYKELDQRFPGSKFILTLRKDTDAYVRSLQGHHERQGIRTDGFVKPHWWDEVFGVEPSDWDYTKSAERYERHNRDVLEYFAGRIGKDLLIVCWENGDGWDSLSRFLNKRQPDEPFPHLGHYPARKSWHDIGGWFNWRSGQEEAVRQFPEGSRFVEVGTYLGRSLCSLAEVIEQSGKNITVIGIDTCRGSGPEGERSKDYHGKAVEDGGGTFAGALHRNLVDCGVADKVILIVADSVAASGLLADGSVEWVHLDARHDYASVRADIDAWLPKIKPGGWLSGDDYDEEKWPDVVRAVRDRLPGAGPWSSGQWRYIVE